MTPHDAALPHSDPRQVGSPVIPVSPAGAEVPAEAGRTEWRAAVPAAPPALGSGPDATTLLKGLRRRWYVAVALGVLLSGAVSAAVWYLLEPKYTAVAQVHIDPVPPWLMYRNIDTPADRGEFLSFERWQATQMKNRFVLNAARKHEEVASLEVMNKQPDQIAFLDDEIKIDYKEGDELLGVTMLSANPEEAKAIVNAVREEYLEQIVKKEREYRSKRKAELDVIVNDAKQHLNGQLKNMHNMAESLGTSDSGALGQKQVMMLSLLSDKQRKLNEVEWNLVQAQAGLKTFTARGKPTVAEPTAADVNVAVAADLDGKQLLMRHARLKLKVEDLERGTRNPNDYILLEYKKELAAADKELEVIKTDARENLLKTFREKAAREYDAALDAVKTELAALTQQKNDLKTQVDGLTEDTAKFGKSSTELERLKEEVAGERRRLDSYEDELEKLNIELRPNVPARVIKYQDAMVLKRDIKRQVLGAAASPVGVLLLVCLAVSWWECRGRRIQTADEVATQLGVRVVGAVPPLPNPALLLGADREEELSHGLLESIDGIRTLLLRDADAAGTRVVMVSSAVSGEGKTTLASHLASSLARAGRRTLLIDCDLRRPAAHQLFELPLQPGFSEALLGEVHIAEATLSSPVDGLWVVPAGQWDREVIQALAKDGVRRIFDKLKNEYDFVVIDSHPVLPAMDSLLIGQHVDTVILSVMRDVSQAPKVYAACQRLATLDIRVFGAVVNGMPEEDVYANGYQYAAPAAR
jgi:capsular exopolysaccharide synthesis family protein